MSRATDTPSVVVTGAAGYIGGQTVLEFSDAGYSVLGIDTKDPSQNILTHLTKFIPADFSTDRAVEEMIAFSPDAIIHCAGSSLVEPSIKNPESYFRNNFVKTKKLLDNLLEIQFKTKFIFSSSAAVYGEPSQTPISESHCCWPISPYGKSKLMIEMLLSAYHRAYGLDYVAFRYFNACGADVNGRHGQDGDATHIIARVVESLKNDKQFIVNGNNYDTPDGTCVRDYIHVSDIAYAHRLAVEKDIDCQPYNLGNNVGISNIDIVNTAQRVINKKLVWKYGKEREGDPATLLTDYQTFKNASGWQPRWKLEDIIEHVWNWRNNYADRVA